MTERPALERWRLVLRLVLALTYFSAGYLHVTRPLSFMRIVPDWVPAPHMTVIVTGVCEMLGAIGLLIPPSLIPWMRRFAGIMLALYAVCVFPANVKHAIHDLTIGGPGALGWGYHGFRLPFQLVIIWWCLFAGGVIDWPFRARARAGSPPAPSPHG
ncbi:DoxX family protein [Sphingomonas bacterium]|uniref:DoxX family protein n=1 Tax=Sphingomonas bacterium TaxID=1895847 RepID=UPI0020C7083C|nr:DoxX family protein [Sphingomonas bacterium]